MHISGPRLIPFRLHRVCPACGANMRPLDRLRQLLFGGNDQHMAHALCTGGKEPTEESSVPTPFGAMSCERKYLCAGISEPHLHITCGKCGFHMLTRTRFPIAGAL